MQGYIMSMDQGTTSSRCMIFDYQGQVAGIAQKEFQQYYPQTGWVEHNPKEIWETQLGVAKEVLRVSGIKPEQIKAIGITNQRETTIVWDKNTGEPVYPAIVWQCRRTAAMIEAWRETGFDKVIYEKTGLIADAYFSATKIKWILDEVEGAREEAKKGNLLFGTVDTWLLWNLTGGKVFATDYTNASRTMLFNIHTLEWDEELLQEMNIPRSMLAEVRPSSYLYGTADEKFFGKEIKICGIAGDQQAALFGQNCYEKGEAKNTYGTGCFLLMNTGDRPIQSKNGLLTTMAATLDDKPVYALEGSVFIAGAVVQWLRDEMGLVKNAAETEAIAESVEDTNGMYFVPAFTGLGAPYWEQNARGTITGLTRGVNRAHFVRAALESMAYQTYDVIKAMEADSGIKLTELKVDGGASNNNFLMQFQADILERTVVRPSVTEVTALGVAYLAGLCVGYWRNREEIKESRRLMSDKRFTGSLDKQIIAEKLEGWKKAVATTITTAE